MGLQQAVMGKSQIPILHKNLKSFILKFQIRWPKSESQIQSNPKSQFLHKYIHVSMNYDLYNREGN